MNDSTKNKAMSLAYDVLCNHCTGVTISDRNFIEDAIEALEIAMQPVYKEADEQVMNQQVSYFLGKQE